MSPSVLNNMHEQITKMTTYSKLCIGIKHVNWNSYVFSELEVVEWLSLSHVAQSWHASSREWGQQT